MLPAAGLTAVLAASCPVVATFHMTARTALWYRVFLPLVRLAARRLDARIAVSEEARRFVERVLPGPYRVIPNAIHVDAYRSARDGGRDQRIVFVCRAEPRKGLPVLLRAFDRLPGTPVLELVGVAAGEVRPRPRVRVHGQVPDAERARARLRELDALRRDTVEVIAPRDAPAVTSSAIDDKLGGQALAAAGVTLDRQLAVGVEVVVAAPYRYREVRKDPLSVFNLDLGG